MSALNATRLSPLALALLAMVGCEAEGGVKLPTTPPAREATVHPVRAVTVSVQPLTVPIRMTGSTAAVREANLGAPTTGRLARLNVKAGDHVEAGALLAQMDKVQMDLRAAQAGAQATAARVQADQAQADLERLAPLGKKGTVPSSRIDALRTQARSARLSARAAAHAATATRRAVRDTELRAPFAGTVLDTLVEVGEVATLAPVTRVIRLADLSTLEIRGRLHERDLGAVKPGAPIVARFPNLNREIQGVVTRLGHEVDPKTRTLELVAQVANPDRQVPLGAFAEVSVGEAHPRRALVLPRTAVHPEAGAHYALVIEGDRVHRRLVKTQPLDTHRVEITDGLEAGEKVVADGLDAVVDGNKVALIGQPEAHR